jgi:hypothetical protein
LRHDLDASATLSWHAAMIGSSQPVFAAHEGKRRFASLPWFRFGRVGPRMKKYSVNL